LASRARRVAAPERIQVNWDRLGRRVLDIGCGGLLIYLLWCAFTFPNATGLLDDDAVYQVTAKSLAEGHGYVRLDRPGQPHQTKYPPVYPLMLAIFWNLGGGYPGNIGWLRIPAVVGAVLTVWLGVRYAVRHLCVGGAGSILLAVMCLTLPELRLFSLITMSELPFAALALATLFLGERAAADAVPGRAGAEALAAGAAAGVAFLTRTVGITLVVAMIGWLMWRRRWRAASLCAAPALGCVAGWALWTRWIAAQEATLRKAELLRYDLDYFAWLPHSLSDLLQVAAVNFGQFAFSNFQMLLRIPGTALTEFFENGAHAWFWHGLTWGALLLVLIGFFYSARRRLALGHVFLALYSVVSLGWPFGPSRFIIPVFPLIAACSICGFGWLLRRLRPTRAARRAIAIPLAAVFSVAVIGLNVDAHELLLSERQGVVRLGNAEMNLEALQQTAGRLREETPANAVIATRRSSVTWLSSGRQTVMLTPYLNPIAYQYSRHRSLGDFYLRPTMDEIEAARRDAQRLLDLYDGLGVTHVVRMREDEPLFAEPLDACQRDHPDRFAVLWSDPRLRVAVLRVLPIQGHGT
jgi:dolichyl-phosphate-mannose-protein mannosyltransferase